MLRVACWILDDDAKARRGGAAGMLPPGDPKIRLRNRWKKWLMMHRNHKVATYSAAYNPAVGDDEIKPKKKEKKKEREKKEKPAGKEGFLFKKRRARSHDEGLEIAVVTGRDEGMAI